MWLLEIEPTDHQDPEGYQRSWCQYRLDGMSQLTGDFNGIGKADVLWIDTLGNVGAWAMNGDGHFGGRELRQRRHLLAGAVDSTPSNAQVHALGTILRVVPVLPRQTSCAGRSSPSRRRFQFDWRSARALLLSSRSELSCGAQPVWHLNLYLGQELTGQIARAYACKVIREKNHSELVAIVLAVSWGSARSALGAAGRVVSHGRLSRLWQACHRPCKAR